EKDDVRVICPFIGGAFGSKGTQWPHVDLCVLAARTVGRPVKLAIEREQMFKEVGGRAETEQTVSIGTDKAGDMKALIHEGRTSTAEYKEYIEPYTKATHLMYDVANMRASQRISKLNICVPTYMRAPGEVTGMYALESAMDEMAWSLGMDPIAFRKANEPAKDPEKQVEWSSRSLIPAMEMAAEKFGWSRRSPKPRSMREGKLLIGMGCAAGTYPENRFGGSAKAKITKEGLMVQSATHEMGTGTTTAQAQLAADFAGLPFERVTMELGDSKLPFAPVSGGSATTGNIGTASHAAIRNLQAKIVELLSANPKSPLYGPDGIAAAAALSFAAKMGSD
ncbi:xanthine dehydrogenase family protein molybdopterin-binding subunit, partial [bacterium]